MLPGFFWISQGGIAQAAWGAVILSESREIHGADNLLTLRAVLACAGPIFRHMLSTASSAPTKSEALGFGGLSCDNVRDAFAF